MKLFISYVNNSNIFKFPGITKLVDEDKKFLIYYYNFPIDILYYFTGKEIILRDSIISTFYHNNYNYNLSYIKEDHNNNLILKLSPNKIKCKNYYTSLKHKDFIMNNNFNDKIYSRNSYSITKLEELSILLIYKND